MRLVLVGPPGAGKGTQAQFIAEHLQVPKISTGDIFRANVSQGTPLGIQAKTFMDRGALVPDDVTIDMVRTRLAEPDASQGFLLDGFPRTVPQAQVLDDMLLETSGAKLDVVLELVVDNEEVVRRLSGRRTCRTCNHIWHVDFDPPEVQGVCDIDGGELYQRDDDKPETVEERLRVYDTETSPLVNYYAGRGLLVGIDATGPVDDVTERAIDALRPIEHPHGQPGASGPTTPGPTVQGATVQGATVQGATVQGATVQGATAQGGATPPEPRVAEDPTPETGQ